ncbi:SMC-Scp complex subunit ScpB, variant 2 [Balamuthia mandrillaris]
MFWPLFGVMQLFAWLVVASQLIKISKSVAELEVRQIELMARLVGRRRRKGSDRPDRVASSSSSSAASLEEALQSLKGGSSGVQQETAADYNSSPNVLVADVTGDEATEAARAIEKAAEAEADEEDEEEESIIEDTEAEIINAEDDEEEDEEAAEFEEQKEDGEEGQPPTQQSQKGPNKQSATQYSPPTKREGDEASIPEVRARAGSFPPSYKIESANNNQLSSIVSSLSSSVAAVLPSFLSSASSSAASQERRRRTAPRKLSSSWYSRLSVPLPNVLRSDKRWRALCELFRVEKYHAKAMRLLCEQIRTPLAELVGTKEEILSNEDIALIFGNVEALMSHERSLLTALQQRLTVDWPKQHASERALADLFDAGVYLKEYKEYVSNHPSAAVHLEHCLNNRPRLVPYLLSKVSLSEMSHGLFLEDLLRLPIQRLPCALFLLTKVKNDTPEPSSTAPAASSPSSSFSSSSERFALEQVLSAYASALKELASVCPTIGDTEQVLRIQQRIDCEKLGQLVLPWRWYVGESKAHELKIEKFVGLMRTRLFFLFSDVLLVVKRRKHNAKKLEWRHTIPLINLRVESLPGSNSCSFFSLSLSLSLSLLFLFNIFGRQTRVSAGGEGGEDQGDGRQRAGQAQVGEPPQGAQPEGAQAPCRLPSSPPDVSLPTTDGRTSLLLCFFFFFINKSEESDEAGRSSSSRRRRKRRRRRSGRRRREGNGRGTTKQKRQQRSVATPKKRFVGGQRHKTKTEAKQLLESERSRSCGRGDGGDRERKGAEDCRRRTATTR